MPQNIEPVRPGDHVVPVRIRAEHWATLIRRGVDLGNGRRLQLVKQPDGVYGLREKG